MRILLDESLPRRLAYELVGHNVRTVTQCGWSAMKNGQLLRTAAIDFDVFLTADQNLQYQQNLENLPLAIIILCAANNRIEPLRPLVPKILDALQIMSPQTLVLIDQDG